MISETIDLYDYFSIARGKNQGGYLTTFVRSHNPENKTRNRPAILVVPGGAYNGISWREGEPIAIRFMNEGYSAFCLNYSVQTPFPIPLFEAAMAMIYIRKNAQKYFVDANFVAALGPSAGGHLVGMLATMFACKEVLEKFRENADYIRPDAVVLCYAVLTTAVGLTHEPTVKNITGDSAALRQYLSIDKNVSKESVPAFLWHTADDIHVPVENSMILASAYRSYGVPFELHIFQSGVHGLSVADIETSDDESSALYNTNVQAWIQLAMQWLKGRGFEVR